SPPSALRADLSPALEAVVLRAMSLEPAARFPSLYELGGALLPFASLRVRLIWETTFVNGRAAIPPTTSGSTSSVGRTLALPVTSDEDAAAGPRTVTLPPERLPRSTRTRTAAARRAERSIRRRRLAALGAAGALAA